MDVLEFKANLDYTDLFSGSTPEGLLAGVPGLKFDRKTLKTIYFSGPTT